MTIRDTTTEAKSRKGKKPNTNTNEIPFATAVPISGTDTSSVRTVTATLEATATATAIPSAPYATTPPRPNASAPYEPEPAPISQIHVVAPARLPEGATFDAYFIVDGIDLQITARVPPGGVVPGSLFAVPYQYNSTPPAEPRLIRVMAPGNLNAGDQFQATIDGMQFYVVVPEGGARQGEYFETYHPSTVALPSRAPVNRAPARAGQGNRWKTELGHACCDQNYPDCLELCCMSAFCPAIVHFQVRQRLSPPNQCSGQCPFMTILFLVWCCLLPASYMFWIFEGSFYRAGDLDEESFDQWLGFMFLFVVGIGIFIMCCMCCTRRDVREHYGIRDHPPRPCIHERRAAWEHDQRITCFCLPCSAAQLATQTHDRKDYPYRCCSKTGLPSNAPAIV